MKWGIRKKLIIFLMLAAVLPFGAGIIITYYETTNSINKRFVSSSHDSIEKGEEELRSYLEDVAQIATVLYRYSPFMMVLKSGISDNLSSNQAEVTRALAYLFNSRQEIEQMHLYIDKGRNSYTNYHSRISGRGEYKDIFSHPYYALFKQGNKDYSIIEPPHEIYSYNNLSVIPESEKKMVISFHNILREIPSEKFLGFLSIDVNLSKIKDIADRLYTDKEEDFYIMNENNVVIYSSDKSDIGKQNKNQWFQQIQKKKTSKKSMDWEDKEFSGVIVFEDFYIQDKKWYIAKRIPYNVLYQSARETVITNCLIGLVSLAIVLITTFFISIKITAPIKVLIANMKKVEKGIFQADFDSLGNDEIGMLGKHFKKMITTINTLIEREYKLDIENKASQLRVLRSQINPHFLYNALQSIGTLALKAKEAQVYALLMALSNIMRYSMNMREDFVPFLLEVKHVKSYLVLQKQRFEEQVEFHIHVTKEAETIQVPKMILQPIVENSFKHGFIHQDKKFLIKIEAWVEENDIVCSITDNGIGVEEQQLKRIEEIFSKKENNRGAAGRESIGLKNIYDRLQIYYNNKARMEVKSKLNAGFSVLIYIPKSLQSGVKYL
ncbi:sensor histidine kinase [Niallia sp. 03133]|uniref:sensor histidine kinase n=1 Tax=Niallia sp. 03133 TaxID=3458060 RepID=UPI004044C7D5